MAVVAENVAIDVARTVQFTAHDTSGGKVTSSSTVVCKIIKQSATVEYWNGSAWVTSDPGNQAMAEDANVTGVYEDSVTYDEAGVDYIIQAWDTTAGNNVIERHARVRGVLAEEADGVCAITVTIKETDTNGDPVPDVTVSIRNSNSDEISRDTTDSNGIAAGLRVQGAATYTVVPALATWTFSNESMVVSAADIAAGTKAVEYYGTTFDPGTPATTYCRVHGWIREVEGSVAIQDQRIVAKLLDKPSADSSGVFYDTQNSQDTPDSDGYWFMDLIRGVNMGSPNVHIYSVRVSDGIRTGAVDKVIVVPDSASATLSSIAAAPIT